MIYKDGGCDSALAAAAADELILAHKVPVILGGMCSHETLAFTKAAEQSKTVVLSYCSVASEISDAGDYIFRNTPSAPHLARFAARYLKKVMDKQRIAILYVDRPYGVSVADNLEKQFTEDGGEVVAKESYTYSVADTDLSSQLAAIKAANADALYFVGYSDQLLVAIKQVREAELGIPIFGGTEWDNPTLWQEPASDGVQYIVASAKVSEEFENTMRSRFGIIEILDCTPQAYDGLKLLAQVIDKAGETPEDIKNELYQTTYTSDISSNQINFDENGDILTAIYLVKRIRRRRVNQNRILQNRSAR